MAAPAIITGAFAIITAPPAFITAALHFIMAAPDFITAASAIITATLHFITAALAFIMSTIAVSVLDVRRTVRRRGFAAAFRRHRREYRPTDQQPASGSEEDDGQPGTRLQLSAFRFQLSVFSFQFSAPAQAAAAPVRFRRPVTEDRS